MVLIMLTYMLSHEFEMLIEYRYFSGVHKRERI